MPRASLRRPILSIALLAACPSGGQDSGTASGPDTATGSTGTTATDTTSTASASATGPATTGAPTTSGTAGSSTTSDSTTSEDSATTAVDPSTTGSSTTGPDTSTTGSSTTGPDTSTTDPDTSTSDDSTTTGTTTGDSSSTGDNIPDTTGGEVCGPGNPNLVVNWNLEVPPHVAGEDLDVLCTIVSTQVQPPKTTLNLSCTIDNNQESVTLHYTLEPFLDYKWTQGGLVPLTYRTGPAPWKPEWLRIVDSLTRFSAVRADALTPPGIPPEDFYWTDVEVAAPCDPEPDPCGSRQGLEVRFKHDFGGMDVWTGVQGGHADVFGFPVVHRVFLAHASRLLEPIGCDDAAPRMFDMVFVFDSSGF